MMIWIFEEMTLKLAVVVRLADPRAEDENRSRREDHVIEVHRGLGCKVAETPTWRASCRCFTTDSLPRGYPGQYVRASAYAALDG